MSFVFQDGDLLVVDVLNAEFPDRCCKSFEAIDATRTRWRLELTVRDGDIFESRDERRMADEDGSNYPFEISPLPSEAMVLVSGLGGVLADTIGWASHRSTLTFHINLPLSPSWRNTRQLGWGGALLLLGIALGIASLLLMMAELKKDDPWRFGAQVAAFIAIALAGTGVTLRFLQNREILQARRYQDGFLWIAGTDSAFRSLFPQWPSKVQAARSPDQL